jgi:peptidoglycan/LPS O-acetylase OafA/YrhL
MRCDFSRSWVSLFFTPLRESPVSTTRPESQGGSGAPSSFIAISGAGVYGVDLFCSQRRVLDNHVAEKPALASVAVLVAAIGSQHALLRIKAILYLGTISYGMYVIHFFGLSFATYLMPTVRLAGLFDRSCLAWGFTILLASVSYRYLEAPFLKLKERFSYIPSRPA